MSTQLWPRDDYGARGGHEDKNGKYCATHERVLLLYRRPSACPRGGIVADTGIVTLPPGVRPRLPAGDHHPLEETMSTTPIMPPSSWSRMWQ